MNRNVYKAPRNPYWTAFHISTTCTSPLPLMYAYKEICWNTLEWSNSTSNIRALQFWDPYWKKSHKPYSHPTEINPTYIYKANKRELTQFRQLENQINLEKLPPWRSWWWTWASSCTNRRSTPTTNRRPSKRTTSSSWRWTEQNKGHIQVTRKARRIININCQKDLSQKGKDAHFVK